MNILVTNDDGIEAVGINELVLSLSKVANIYVCAPDSQKSACGHGITINMPLIVREWKMEGAKAAYRVSGTPADCVKVGLKKLTKDLGVTIDAVFSGTNHGANLATDVLYSGTVSGAIEGLMCGYSAVAVSVASPVATLFEGAGAIAAQVCQKMEKEGIAKGTMLNINVPHRPLAEIKGVKVTKLGIMQYEETFEMRKSPFGLNYFWYGGAPAKMELEEDMDIAAIKSGYISITPMHFDLTDYKRMEDVKAWDFKI